MAQNTLRQSIQTWQRRLEMTGMGLVETPLERRAVCDDWSDTSTIIDATLAHLSRLTPSQFAVELAYPWGREDGNVGALLGTFAGPCDSATGSWPEADAA